MKIVVPRSDRARTGAAKHGGREDHRPGPRAPNVPAGQIKSVEETSLSVPPYQNFTVLALVVAIAVYCAVACPALFGMIPGLWHEMGALAPARIGGATLAVMLIVLAVLSSGFKGPLLNQRSDVKAAEQRYRLYFDAGLARIIEFNPEARIVDRHDACARLFA